MYLVLPNDNKNIGDTLEAMENVKDLDQDLSEANVTISLPKFKIAMQSELFQKSLSQVYIVEKSVYLQHWKNVNFTQVLEKGDGNFITK